MGNERNSEISEKGLLFGVMDKKIRLTPLKKIHKIKLWNDVNEEFVKVEQEQGGYILVVVTTS